MLDALKKELDTPATNETNDLDNTIAATSPNQTPEPTVSDSNRPAPSTTGSIQQPITPLNIPGNAETDSNTVGVSDRSTDQLATPSRAIPSSNGLRDENLIAVWDEVENLVQEQKFKVALGRLTRFFHSTELSPPQRQRLMQWLNALAGKVIYSAEHHMFNKPYVVQANDTLAELASRWKVPAQLIYNVNKHKIGDPSNLVPGTELKVVMGSFNGLVDLSNNTITLFAKNLYAGQFPISASAASQIADGEYVISNKLPNIRDNTKGNPFTLVLENGVQIAAAQEASGEMIGLSRKDAADIFSILSMGSNVSIRR